LIEPGYVKLFREGRLGERIAEGLALLRSCSLCPRKCGVDRLEDERTGTCRTGRWAEVASFNAHHGEEPPISGQRGSGTIFFSHCNLKCAYCQNYPLSQMGEGRRADAEDLAGMMLSLQERGCHNVNLVTPTHVVPQILEALEIAASQGFSVPIVYNSSGYDSLEELRLLDGVVDIYMPDARYGSNELAARYSGVKDYVGVNRAALKEMNRQVGDLVLDEEGVAQRGLLVRHLVLPQGLAGSEEVLSFIADEVSSETYLSLMAQYFPAYQAVKDECLGRRITAREYEQVLELAERFGLTRGWSQEFSEL
jgi:putative pyruvate formate lyase activating enzyme